ncbi:MAG: nucleotidyltransferase domain-containing protein [Desulfuromonadales bacterium]|nr:nucleotidyltransferase domain-containing protein [Desulfuromonadales bacterium]
MDKTIVLNFLRAHKEELALKFGVEKIGLFGSYAKDQQHDGSDIDLAILSNNKDFFVREDLREYLEKNLGVPVDVGYIDSFRSYYREQIDKEIIYA